MVVHSSSDVSPYVGRTAEAIDERREELVKPERLPPTGEETEGYVRDDNRRQCGPQNPGR
jgi:hypothetical protein